jgi:hypothetical protein
MITVTDSTRDQIVRFACVGRRKTKHITDIGTETASYKVVPLGSKGTGNACLSTIPLTPCLSLLTHMFAPTTVVSFGYIKYK